MLINLLQSLSFILVTNITPGPNNISSAQTGLTIGYKRSLPYLLGIITGIFCLLLFGAFASSAVLAIFPSLEKILCIAGSLYILYLAWKTLGADYSFNEKIVAKPLSYVNGILLQLMNPKAIIYCLTLYSSVLAGLRGHIIYLLVSAIFSVTITFFSVSAWALGGAAIRNFMENKKLKRVVNVVLSLSLVFTAVQIVFSVF
jgi:cysteine/O-acetylserine efflux protein